jgi:hypothetical protein
MYAAKGASPFAGFCQTSCVKRQKNTLEAGISIQSHDVLRFTFDALASGNARFRANVTFKQATLAVTIDH